MYVDNVHINQRGTLALLKNFEELIPVLKEKNNQFNQVSTSNNHLCFFCGEGGHTTAICRHSQPIKWVDRTAESSVLYFLSLHILQIWINFWYCFLLNKPITITSTHTWPAQNRSEIVTNKTNKNYGTVYNSNFNSILSS